MRRDLSTPRRLVVLLVVLGGLSVQACSTPESGARNQAGNTADSGDDEGAVALDPDAGNDSSSDDGASPPAQTSLRIAHVSPDMPPIDVCVAPHGTADFRGPLIGHLVDASAGDAGDDAEGGVESDAGAAPGVAYLQVSAYLFVDPEQLDVRIVAAGAASCAMALVPDSTALPTPPLNGYATLLVAGEVSPVGNDKGITVAMLPDDAALGGGAASLRAINAMANQPSLDFGLESSSATNWVPLLADVPFAASSAKTNPDDGVVDRNGYVAITPFSAQAVSARPSSSDAATDLAAARVTIEVGSIVTVIAIGGKTGDAAHPPALLFCTDNEPSGAALADCGVVQ